MRDAAYPLTLKVIRRRGRSSINKESIALRQSLWITCLGVSHRQTLIL